MNLLILFVASSLFEWAELALASTEVKGKNDFEFQRNLRAEGTRLTADFFESVIKEEYQDFPHSIVKDFLSNQFKGKRPPSTTKNLKHKVLMNDPRLKVLKNEKFEKNLRRAIPALDDKYLNIVYYLAMLEINDGSLFDAASAIHRASTFLGLQTIADRMENGQFRLWNKAKLSEDKARYKIFLFSSSVKWRITVLARYKKFLEGLELETHPTEAAGTSS
ncbi:hypothetical protein PsorP6_018093 [Peronosclerospora sorghi]|uniref:Uncharacterized protein n=1 Tax=Peronosclerospora sorghi TaxID=230839 RepID=A0ACC0WEX0_9STRA|nr:hypothetical protein PsorP6_018093 [Peronosclerospora sorghi]